MMRRTQNRRAIVNTDRTRSVAWLAAGVAAGCALGCKAEPDAKSVQPVASVAVDAPEVVATNEIQDGAFSLRWTPNEGVVAGASANGRLVLEAKPPFKCNQDYPYKLKLVPAGVVPEKVELTKPDMEVSKMQVVVPITFSASAQGEQAFEALFAFSVCTDDKCLIERKNLRMTVLVKAP